MVQMSKPFWYDFLARFVKRIKPEFACRGGQAHISPVNITNARPSKIDEDGVKGRKAGS